MLTHFPYWLRNESNMFDKIEETNFHFRIWKRNNGTMEMCMCSVFIYKSHTNSETIAFDENKSQNQFYYGSPLTIDHSPSTIYYCLSNQILWSLLFYYRFPLAMNKMKDSCFLFTKVPGLKLNQWNDNINPMAELKCLRI